MIKGVLLVCFGILISSCTEYFDEGKEQIALSYHMQCAGSHSVSTFEMNNLCNRLVNQKLNSMCDLDYRKNLFDKTCGEKVFPHKVNPKRWSSPRYSYEYIDESKCSTGKHYFYYEEAADLRKNLCEVLKDDSLNNNCEKAQREKDFREFCL